MRVTGVAIKDIFAKLIISDKFPKNIPLSCCLARSFTQMTTHTHTQTHSLAHQCSAVSKVPWQSITAVETAQVLFMRKMLATTRMKLWTSHTQGATRIIATPAKIDPLPGTKAVHKTFASLLWVWRGMNSLNCQILHYFASQEEFFFSLFL